MSETKPAAKTATKPAAKTVNVTIKAVNGKAATGGYFVASGPSGKMLPGQVCQLPEALADKCLASDRLEITRKPATHRFDGKALVALNEAAE